MPYKYETDFGLRSINISAERRGAEHEYTCVTTDPGARRLFDLLAEALKQGKLDRISKYLEKIQGRCGQCGGKPER